jgi:hypothetical protein
MEQDDLDPRDLGWVLEQDGTTSAAGREIDYALLYPLEGNYVYVGPRGLPEMHERVSLDLHLERLFDLRGRRVGVSLDALNVTGARDITPVQTMVNNGRNYWPDLAWSSTPGDQFYDAALERVSPRVLRLGLVAYF